MKKVVLVLRAEAHVQVEVPDDWDETEFCTRTGEEHDTLLQELAEDQGAYYEVPHVIHHTLNDKPAPYVWYSETKTIEPR